MPSRCNEVSTPVFHSTVEARRLRAACRIAAPLAKLVAVAGVVVEGEDFSASPEGLRGVAEDSGAEDAAPVAEIDEVAPEARAAAHPKRAAAQSAPAASGSVVSKGLDRLIFLQSSNFNT